MSLNGLEKITDKILADANERAARILADAEAQSEAITAEYQARANAIKEELFEAAEREGMGQVSRAKATVATAKRNLLLATKSELIDDVFDSALDGTKKLADENYTDLLVGLLCAAMLEELEAEEKSRLYDELDAEAPESYEVLLNERDRDRVGKAVVEGARKKLEGKADAKKLSRLTLSKQTVAIDGGLILRCGDVEANCSFSLLFAQLRQELEGDVSRALFDARGQR